MTSPEQRSTLVQSFPLAFAGKQSGLLRMNREGNPELFDGHRWFSPESPISEISGVSVPIESWANFVVQVEYSDDRFFFGGVRS